MNEKIKDGATVILVNERGSQDVKILKGTDKNGKPETVEPKKANEPQFLKFDKHSNPVENFFSNFIQQLKDPTHFNFFQVPAENIESIADLFKQMLKNPDEPSNRTFLEDALLDPEKYGLSETKNDYKPIDESRVDWDTLKNMGVTKETLEKTGSLEAMLNYRKTPILFNVTISNDGIVMSTQARLSLRETPDGKIGVQIHGVRKEPSLDKPFYGNTFTDEDKAQLKNTGNLGRIIELTIPTTGEIIPAFVSVDKLTNDIVAYRADKLKLPDELKGVALSDEQKATLSQGGSIYLENMTANSGKQFSANVQFNADKRSLEFRFDNGLSQGQEFRIPTQIGGVELPEELQATLKEGKTIYVEGLKDKQGQEYNAYIKVNNEKGKLDFFRWNPDKRQNIFPDNQSQTQVAVNSEGKNNEATKDVNEPLKQGQIEPTEQQKPKGPKL